MLIRLRNSAPRMSDVDEISGICMERLYPYSHFWNWLPSPFTCKAIYWLYSTSISYTCSRCEDAAIEQDLSGSSRHTTARFWRDWHGLTATRRPACAHSCAYKLLEMFAERRGSCEGCISPWVFASRWDSTPPTVPSSAVDRRHALAL